MNTFKEAWLKYYKELKNVPDKPEVWAIMIKVFAAGWLAGSEKAPQDERAACMLSVFALAPQLMNPHWLPDESWVPKKEEHETSMARPT